MKVILQENVEGVGHLGDVLDVKDGFARNYLLPRRKALQASPLATEADRLLTESERGSHRQDG